MLTFVAEIVATFGTLSQLFFSNNATEREVFYSVLLICFESSFLEIHKVDNVGIFGNK